MDDLRHRLAEWMVPAFVVLLLSIESAAKHQHVSAPAALSWQRYLIFLAIAIVLAAIQAVRKRNELRDVALRLGLSLAVVAAAFAVLLPGWPFGGFVVVTVALGTWLLWLILLSLALELNLWVDKVRQCVERTQALSKMILLTELATGIATGCTTMVQAGLSSGYVTTVVIMGFVVFLVVAWLTIFRQTLWQLIRG
jgi:hypothetical protein